jgi:hypothetical protein
MEKYHELYDDTKDLFKEIISRKSFSVDLRLEFVGSTKQKELVKVSRIPDQYSFILGKELLVIINESMLSSFDDESVTILMEQEIDKIQVNYETGKVKLVKPDLSTFSSLVTKWGLEKISRANQITELYTQQTADAAGELI